ncbi:cysteine proteinase [Gonapodya prolifera JEL478]|uniref:Cysteine proteinase n=1 Tax=Gonapodya prolifera (strain JEL478) TaxID=1344416 RepID=A0A139AAJ4_GONPJ|nr:cysteine proteinase [Gonapodya prolifera JEL478]|eukprot:KXS13872.1 cysteine proteinase [Gonapodya prolifera JEL478]
MSVPIADSPVPEEPKQPDAEVKGAVPAPDAPADANEDDDDDEDEEERVRKQRRAAAASDAVVSELYLDTVNRTMLDFDFEKLCSVSLSNLNVYACLVCGKYFQGRGSSSHAYVHSVHQNHHVFINLLTLRIYILPDGYEVTQRSLDDIKYVIRPTFTHEQVSLLDARLVYSYDLNNKRFLPGFVGLNNVKANDYINVAVQALAHVAPLRDFFLLNDMEGKSDLVIRLSTLLRKLWSPLSYKSHVAPHELLQAISAASEKRFSFTEQGDVVDFLGWFLNEIHKGLTGGKMKKGCESIIHETFQGQFQMQTQVLELTRGSLHKNDKQLKNFDEGAEIKTTKSPFLFLALDLPPAPLFQDEMDKNIIPQVALSTLLNKYDGATGQESANLLRRFRLLDPPRYLVFHIKRFTRNNWTTEKNPTIVTFPIKNLDMRPLLPEVPATLETRFDLIANIIHEGRADQQGTYKVHLRGPATGETEQWYAIQDLIVEEILPQMIFLSESYVQIWERKDVRQST